MELDLIIKNGLTIACEIIAISKGDEIFSRGISYTQRVMNVTQEYEL
ncbi:hypothetical protein [Thermosynechococcus sp. B0]|nr:hypothetical protein [Thermosynechococcus sp. B0]